MMRTLSLPLLLLLAACSQGAASQAEITPSRRVRTMEVEAAPTHLAHRLYGITEASDRAALSFPSGGRITERMVAVGDTVQRGQPLARVDTLPLRNAHAAALASVHDLASRLAQAERDAERARHLAASGGATAQELERAESQLASLRASLDATEAQAAETARRLGEGTLVAPFDGVVTEAHLEAGETAGPGAAVLTLAGSGAIEVTVGVPESLITELRVGDAATVDLPALHRTVSATLTQVGGATAGAGALFPVIATLEPAPWLRPGLTAEVLLYTPVDARIAVPVRAVVDPTGTAPSVYRVRGGTAQRVAIEPGPLLGERLAVEGALLPSDELVVEGLVGLLDGETVQVLQ